MNKGERYHYIQAPWDLIVEILEVLNDEEVFVCILQCKSKDKITLGRPSYAWEIHLGKWEYLPGQDRPQV